MATELRALLSIITQSIDVLESCYSKSGTDVPSLDEPVKPGPPNENIAVIQVASHIITAAAAQLIAAVRTPEETLLDYSSGMYTVGALGFAVDTNVPDILKEAGPILRS